MQSCWLPPSQRPSVAEIFLLLSSLLAAERGLARRSVGEEDEEDEEFEEGRRMRGESEESFERRWDLLRPPAFHAAANERHRDREYSREDRDNSYPLLDPVGNCISSSSSELDDILTVTETSKGLNFEYFWEKAHARRGYKPLPPPQPIPTVNSNHRQSLDTPTVVPVISARSPSLVSEYYIRLEEHTPQDRSPTLKAKPTVRSNSMCAGDVELVEIRSGMLGKEHVPYCSDPRGRGKSIQMVRSNEVQIKMPNTGVAEFRDTSSRVTDFSIVDLGDDEEEDKKKSKDADNKSSQAPLLPPKPRSMSMSSANHVHSRPLPAPPQLGYRGLPHYNMSGKIETDPLHVSSCPPSTFDHLGLHRTRQTLPPSPSLSPSLPPSSHPIYPMPQVCPPPLPPHAKPQRGYHTLESYSRHSTHSNRDPVTSDLSEREGNMRHSSRSKDFDSPIRRENLLRPIYRNIPRPQNLQIERQSSSSPTYSDEDDSPFGSPDKSGCDGTTIAHSSLSEDADPAVAELFSRGMKRTQSRLDTILPAIWKEDAELQEAAKKSPMHLFLTEISSVPETSGSKSETSSGEDKRDRRDGESWGNFILPNRGMRRSQSLLTDLGSTGQAWGADKYSNSTAAEEGSTVTEDSCQGDLFLTEVDTGGMDTDVEEEPTNDSVKYLYPAGSRLRPYVCAPGHPSYSEAEEAYSKGMQRSRSLLSEISLGKQEEKEPKQTEMTREEFLKEIQSAETFLTEIMSRQNAAVNKKEEPAYSPTPLSPEYESICIDPDSAQTIRFQSESSIRASNIGKDDTQTEAIYAQVTKRAKKSEIKVSVRPEIPILHIASNIPLKAESHGSNTASHCQSTDFVFSEIMPKNGLLHNQTRSSQNKEEECIDGPALPARGVDKDRQLAEETDTVIMRMNELLLTNDSQRAALIGNDEIIKNGTSPQTDEKTDSTAQETEIDTCADKTDLKSNMGFQNDDEHFNQIKNAMDENNLSHVTHNSAAPTTPDWDGSSDPSLMTPTDSVLSPMTSSSADGLTPSDSWSGGGSGGVWRPLGTETLHRDSAYFSDSDWEGDGIRRSSDGLVSRSCNGRGGVERGTLSEIEERSEEEREAGEKSPLKNSIHTVDQSEYENDLSDLFGDDDTINKGLVLTQRDDSGIFHDSKTLLCDDPQTRDCVEVIDKLFSKLDDKPLKGFQHSSGYPNENHYTDGIIYQIADCRSQDSADNYSNLHSKSNMETNILSGSEGKDHILIDNEYITHIVNNISVVDNLKCTNDAVVALSRVESKLCDIQDATSNGQTSGVKPSHEDTLCRVRSPSWSVDSKKSLELEQLNPNALSLSKLRCPDDGEVQRAGVTTETEKQLSNNVVAVSPIRGAELWRDGSVDKDSCEENWNEICSSGQEEEDEAGCRVVKGEFDCHRFSQKNLGILCPDENDQWASPERRGQDTELTAELFSGFNNKLRDVREQVVVGEEFWENEENDERAGREPHPAVLEGCEDTWNDETQGLGSNTCTKQERDQQSVQDVNIQQEENIEDLAETSNLNKGEDERSNIEVENIEIPEGEAWEGAERTISLCTKAVQNIEGLLESIDTEENQNFNSSCTSIYIHITKADDENFSELENKESVRNPESEMSPIKQYVEAPVGIMNSGEGYRDMSFESRPSDMRMQDDLDRSDVQDNFSSVDFPSPPPSIDLDVQDDKLESLDDSFPSPPPSVIESEEFISDINLEVFVASCETEPYIPPTHNAHVPEPPATNHNISPGHIKLAHETALTSKKEKEDAQYNSLHKTSPDMPQDVHTLPKLLISEWKDLDEEPLEDFEKLEKLCCISGDEEDLFLGNLELLGSLKKRPDQKDSGPSFSEGTEDGRWDKPEDLKTKLVGESEDKTSSHDVINDTQTPDVKDQSTLSKMTTMNGLMMQVSLFQFDLK